MGIFVQGSLRGLAFPQWLPTEPGEEPPTVDDNGQPFDYCIKCGERYTNPPLSPRLTAGKIVANDAVSPREYIRHWWPGHLAWGEKVVGTGMAAGADTPVSAGILQPPRRAGEDD